MHVAYFTERPYRGLDEDEILKNHAYFAVPNSQFDHIRGSELYNEYLDEYVYAEELGFDGVALNEHHGNPFCMGGVMNVEASILARITDRVRIPMLTGRRSLNLANAAAIAVYEAWRQQGFAGAS